MTRKTHPSPSQITNVITPSVPLWLVAVVFFKEDSQLCYAIDWTPVLALGSSPDTFLETSALILHYEREAPIWVNPETKELRELNDFIAGQRHEDEAILASRIVAVEPSASSADPLADVSVFNGLLVFNDAKFDQFQFKDELHHQELCWASLS